MKEGPCFFPTGQKDCSLFLFFLVSSEKEESLDLGSTWTLSKKREKESVWVPKVSRVLSLNLQPRTLSNYVPFWIFVAPCIMCFCPATFTSNHICIISPNIKQNPVSKKYSKLIRNLVKSHSSASRHITQPKGGTRKCAVFFVPLQLFLFPYIG